MEETATPFNSGFRFKDGAVKNAPRIPKRRWGEHKELLCSLYHEKTIADMITFMQTEHDFVAK